MYTIVWKGNSDLFAKSGFRHLNHVKNWVAKHLSTDTQWVVANTTPDTK